MADLVPEGSLFRVDSDETSIVQEVTMTVGRLVAKLAEEELFGVEGARRPERDEKRSNRNPESKSLNLKSLTANMAVGQNCCLP